MNILRILTLLFLISINTSLFSQTIETPNSAFASHPLMITKIELSENQTVIELELENQSPNGYFCADKSISLLDTKRSVKYELIKSKGIPVCPANYKFKSVGEKLTFQLFFPEILPQTKYLSIIENCDNNCFSILGIIIDSEMNTEINLAYNYYFEGKLDFALAAFLNVIKNNPDYQFGYLYSNVIQIYAEKNDIESAKLWYNKLNESEFMDKKIVLNNLKSKAYYSKLIF